MKNAYMRFGLILIIAGLGSIWFFYTILESVPLIALGISIVLLGFTSMSLANTRPQLSPELSRIMIKTGVENTFAFLRELAITEKAIYFPANQTDGISQALIPLGDNFDIRKIKELLRQYFIVRTMPDSEAIAIAIMTPGNLSLDLLPDRPETIDEIEPALGYLFTRELDIARGVKVSLKDNKINIEIKKPDIIRENELLHQIIGSPFASMAAAVSSEALQKPVRIIGENNRNQKNMITLEVLS